MEQGCNHEFQIILYTGHRLRESTLVSVGRGELCFGKGKYRVHLTGPPRCIVMSSKLSDTQALKLLALQPQQGLRAPLLHVSSHINVFRTPILGRIYGKPPINRSGRLHVMPDLIFQGTRISFVRPDRFLFFNGFKLLCRRSSSQELPLPSHWPCFCSLLIKNCGDTPTALPKPVQHLKASRSVRSIIKVSSKTADDAGTQSCISGVSHRCRNVSKYIKPGVVLKSLISTQKGFEPASLNGRQGRGALAASVITPAREKPLNPRICRCAANLLALPCQTVPVKIEMIRPRKECRHG